MFDETHCCKGEAYQDQEECHSSKKQNQKHRNSLKTRSAPPSNVEKSAFSKEGNAFAW